MARKACKNKGNKKKQDSGKGKPNFSCSKCGLKAINEKHLCKPKKV